MSHTLFLDTDSEDEAWRGSDGPSSEDSLHPHPPLPPSSPDPSTPSTIRPFFSPFRSIRMPDSALPDEDTQTSSLPSGTQFGNSQSQTQPHSAQQPEELTLQSLFAITAQDRSSMGLSPKKASTPEVDPTKETDTTDLGSESSRVTRSAAKNKGKEKAASPSGTEAVDNRPTMHLILELPHYDRVGQMRPLLRDLGLGEGAGIARPIPLQKHLVSKIQDAENKHFIWKYKTFHKEACWKHPDYKGKWEDLDEYKLTFDVTMAKRGSATKVLHPSSKLT